MNLVIHLCELPSSSTLVLIRMGRTTCFVREERANEAMVLLPPEE